MKAQCRDDEPRRVVHVVFQPGSKEVFPENTQTSIMKEVAKLNEETVVLSSTKAFSMVCSLVPCVKLNLPKNQAQQQQKQQANPKQ